MTDPTAYGGSWYAATMTAAPERGRLTVETDVDVCVVGGGLAGLTAAREIARRGWSLTPQEALDVLGQPSTALVDLREPHERETQGVIPGSLHMPYDELEENIRGGGLLHELAVATGKRIVFYCAFGERSAMAVEAAQEAGLTSARHIQGGIDAWTKAGGPIVG